MFNIELVRNDPALAKIGLGHKGENGQVIVDELLELDGKRRELITERDSLRATHNKISNEIGSMLRDTEDGKSGSNIVMNLKEEERTLASTLGSLEVQVKDVDAKIKTILINLPNLPAKNSLLGASDKENKIVRTSGEKIDQEFEVLPHWESASRLGIMDLETGSKLSGSRFFLLKGYGAKLERSIISWMLDVHTKEHGYTEISPPFLVNGQSVLGSGHLPKFADTMYKDIEEDLWLLPTAEVALTNLHRDEILSPGVLPLYYVANTPCFRREKTAAGKDTRGIKRVHQFNKVELYKIVSPDESENELERLLNDAEVICSRLGLPYRVVEICSGDLGFSSAKTYDIEMWAPGIGEWLEVSSCSNCTDFQAYRANVRYRPSKGAKVMHPHMLNGSGLALPRVLISIIENCQQSDGSILLPEVLRDYVGVDRIS